jgi:hypothetical protein
MAGTLYARYIPPKSSSAPLSKPGQLQQEQEQPRTLDDEGVKDKAKQSKKDKKATGEVKRKKRKVEEIDAQEGDDNSQLMRGQKRSKSDKAVLSKFEKASRAAEKLKTDDESSTNDEAHTEEPDVVLHGTTACYANPHPIYPPQAFAESV